MTASVAQEYERHSGTQWYVRQYHNDYEMAVPEGGRRDDALVYDKDGNCLNKLVFEDPNIALDRNFNLITTAGKNAMWSTLLALSGSGSFLTLAYGSGSTAADPADTHLTAELILDSTRVPLTNASGTPMTGGSVVSSSNFVDSGFTPNITYTSLAAVMATINGATSANVNKVVRELAIASNINCPGTPVGTSGIIFNHYVLGADISLTNTTTLQIVINFRA